MLTTEQMSRSNLRAETKRKNQKAAVAHMGRKIGTMTEKANDARTDRDTKNKLQSRIAFLTIVRDTTLKNMAAD